jgi:hypothetical protein
MTGLTMASVDCAPVDGDVGGRDSAATSDVGKEMVTMNAPVARLMPPALSSTRGVSGDLRMVGCSGLV